MCCLGQFSKQIDKNIDIYNMTQPSDCEWGEDNILVNKNGLELLDTALSSDCIDINDDEVPISKRIQRLKKRLKEDKIELIIKNDKLFDAKGRFIGKHLIRNELGGPLSRYVNKIEMENGLPVNLESLEYTRKLIRVVGKNKAREIIKKCLGDLYEED